MTTSTVHNACLSSLQ